MNTTATDVTGIERIDHREAMAITEVEFDRMVACLRALEPSDWARRTDCEAWDVRAVALHLLGAAESNASMRESVHQIRKGKRLFKEMGGHHWVDGVNEIQIRERSDLGVEELINRYVAVAPRAVSMRRRLPRPVRALPLVVFPEPIGRMSVGYLMDMVYTRDVWMHRVDISRAVGHDMELTAEHDGRIVADMVAEWAALHGEPFTLELEGPAGGSFRAGGEDEYVRIDAIEFTRIVSGRGDASGILAHPLPL